MSALQSSAVLPWVLSYLFNALWQIPMVFAAAWIATRILRRAGPRIEHRVWVAALLLQIALPACSLRIPYLWQTLLSIFPATGADNVGGIRVVFGPATAAGGTLRLPFAFETGIVLAWLCCIFYFAGRLAWGLHQTRSIARAATRITLSGDTALRYSQYLRCLGITARSPEIAVSPHGMGPVTLGLRRGLVLVPSTFLDNIHAGDLDALLAHELAHIARRDFAKNLLYGLVSLPAAWHPVMWRTRDRVAESRELVCDAIAADAIAADAITTDAIASEATAGRRQYAQALLRIAALFAERPPVANLHALGIFNVNADSSTLERRVMTLTRKPAPISTARRILLAAASSAIAFATCASALALHTGVAALAPIDAQNSQPAKIHVRRDVMSGQRISGDNPKYPEEARAKKIRGTVVLGVIISKDGTVENIRVQTTPAESLAKSAIEAVRTWRYRPYLLNGNPIEVETTVNVTYTLAG
jgi:TonB family protein